MFASALAALLIAWQPAPAVQAQDPRAFEEPADLGDIEVDGRTLERATQDFVNEVGDPSRGRGLARWRRTLCVGVANLRPAAAQFIVDRISDRARGLGLQAGDPGCIPSVMIIATQDANAFTPQFVGMRPRLFNPGGAGMSLGNAALRRFQETDRPVRWWVVSKPVDETGKLAVRVPGRCRDDCQETMDFAPQVESFGSRLSSPLEDDIGRVFIIVDVDQVATLTPNQLADYLAMVTLAQIDPDAETGRYSTILNVLDDPANSPGMTQWDQAYLNGLYDAQRMQVNLRANGSEIARSIIRVRQAMDSESNIEP